MNIKEKYWGKKVCEQCESKRENTLESDRPEERQRGDGVGRRKSDLIKKTAEVRAFSKTFTFADGRKVNGRYYYVMNKGVLTWMGSIYRWQEGFLEGEAEGRDGISLIRVQPH